MKPLQAFVLILLLLLSAFVRLYRLDSIPEGFHADEAAFGYNAYSLLKTGKDEYGKPFPLILKSFGDYKGAIYSYLTIPTVAAFGLNEFSVRLPTAIAGILIVTVSAVLAFALTGNAPLSIISAAIVSFAPSSILLSRVQSDPLVAVLFMLSGWYCMHRYTGVTHLRWAAGALGFWLVSLFTYASPRVLLLGFIPLMFWYYLPRLPARKKFVFIGIFACVAMITLYLQFGFLGSRFGQVSVFSSQDVMLPLEEQIREDGIVRVPVWSARLHHNKFVDYARFIARNYAGYFSFDFLFSQAYQPEREKIPNTGVMYLVDLPFLLIGLYQILKTKKRWGYFILGWFLFTPLALSVFGQETPNIHRYYFSIFPTGMIVAYGILSGVAFVKKEKRRIAVLGIVILYAVHVELFLHELFVHQPVHAPMYRGFANKRMVEALQQMKENYDKIVITKANQSPYAYVLFFTQYDPVVYQHEGSPRDLDYSGFDKYIFVPMDCPNVVYSDTMKERYPGKRILYVNNTGCDPTAITKHLQSIYWRDGTEAFQFVENIATESASPTSDRE